MLYHIRVVAPVHDLSSLADYADVVATPTEDGALLSCRVPDAAALAGLIALLTDLGVPITEMRAMDDSADGAPG